MKKKRFQWSNVYLTLILLLMYLPIFIVIIYSFNDSKLSTVWSGFSIRWYQKLLHNTQLMQALKNSLILAFLSCGISAVVGTIGAVGLARSKWRTRGVLESVCIIPIMIPEIILGMVFLAFFSLIGLKFGMLTLVISHTAFCIPYIFMMVKSRLAGMDTTLEDAALDLGASPIRVFLDITLPLILPAVLSGTLLAFAMSLDDVVISFFVTGPSTNTLPVKIFSQMKMGVTPEINALCTLILTITFLIVILSRMIAKRAK